MTRRWRVLALPLAAVVTSAVGAPGCQACGRSSESAVDTPAPRASMRAPVAGVSPSARQRPFTPLQPHCRVVSLDGGATVASIAGTPLEAGVSTALAVASDIPDGVWVDLDSGGRMTTRHPRSAREATFVGPARVRACVGVAEEVWVARGRFESVAGAGERPGAEEWVITPVGVVRYGAAQVTVNVATAAPSVPANADVAVTSGTAYAWTGDQAGPVQPPEVSAPDAPGAADGWIRLEGGSSVSLAQKVAAKAEEATKTAVDRCVREAKAAKDLALVVASPDAALAQVAPQHVIARRLARASCDVALMRVGLLAPSPARDGFYGNLSDADATWKSLRSREGRGRLP